MRAIPAIALMALCSLPTQLNAEGKTVCTGEVGYKWSAPASAGAAEENKAAPTELTESFGRLQVFGADEKAAKSALAKESARLAKKAAAQCRAAHENSSGCLAGKFAAMTPQLQQVSFTVRRKMEEAAAADCTVQLGRCLGSFVTDPVCEVLVDPAAAAVETKKDKKADKKK